MVFKRNRRALEGTDQTSEDNGTGSLNVVVEDGVGVAIPLERPERRLEVFELDHNTSPPVRQLSHHLIQEFLLLDLRDALVSCTHVKIVLEEFFIVGSKVKGNGKSALRVNAGTANVESKLSDGNSHAVDTEITKAENAGTVRDDGDLDILLGPIGDHFFEVALVGVRKVETLGVRVDMRPFQASFADGGSVDVRSKLLEASQRGSV